MTRRRAPAELADVLSQALREAAPETALARVQVAWPSVVGPVIAAEASPSEERDGAVLVDCASAVWAQELELLGPDLRERLNAALGTPLVRRLRFRVKAP